MDDPAWPDDRQQRKVMQAGELERYGEIFKGLALENQTEVQKKEGQKVTKKPKFPSSESQNLGDTLA